MIKDRFFHNQPILVDSLDVADIYSPVIEDAAPELREMLLRALNGSLSLGDYAHNTGEYDDDEDMSSADYDDNLDIAERYQQMTDYNAKIELAKLKKREEEELAKLKKREQEELDKLKKTDVDIERTDPTEGGSPDKSEE